MPNCANCGARIPMFGETRQYHILRRCVKLSPTRIEHDREETRKRAIREGERGKDERDVTYG